MKSDAELMVKESDKLCTDSNAVKANIRALRTGLRSEAQRRGHSNIHRQFKEQNEELMTALKNIMDFKIESVEEVNRVLSSGHCRALRWVKWAYLCIFHCKVSLSKIRIFLVKKEKCDIM